MAKRRKPQVGTSLSQETIRQVDAYVQANNVSKTQLTELGLAMAMQLNIEQLHTAIVMQRTGKTIDFSRLLSMGK